MNHRALRMPSAGKKILCWLPALILLASLWAGPGRAGPSPQLGKLGKAIFKLGKLAKSRDRSCSRQIQAPTIPVPQAVVVNEV